MQNDEGVKQVNYFINSRNQACSPLLSSIFLRPLLSAVIRLKIMPQDSFIFIKQQRALLLICACDSATCGLSQAHERNLE